MLFCNRQKLRKQGKSMSVDVNDDLQPTSRRRQAMVAGGRRQDDAVFTMADVASLKTDRTAEARINVARRLGLSLDRLGQGSTRDMAHGILQLLMRDVEQEVRKALAESVAASRTLPEDFALDFCRDDFEIARPVLENSPVLSDEKLADIVRTNAMQYALAIAGREQISEMLSQTLVDHGDESVVVRLVGNLGAKLSERTMMQIVDDYAGSRSVNERLVRRPALPPVIITEMVSIITNRLTWELVGRDRMDAQQAAQIVNATRERAKTSVEALGDVDRERAAELEDEFRNGELTPDRILDFLRHGDVASYEVGMSVMSDLPVDQVRRLSYDPDRRFLSGLCARAQFPTAHYITLRMALELAEATVTEEINHRGYSNEPMRLLQKQYETLVHDELAIDELLYGE